MVTSTSGVQSGNPVMDFSVSATTPTASVDSFAQQLLTAIETYMGNSGSGSQLQINVQSTGQNSAGSSQFLVSVEDTPAPAASATPAANATPSVTTATQTTSPAATTPAAAAPAAATPAATAAVAATAEGGTLTAAQLAQMTPAEAYWAGQPPAIQALQNMPMDQRAAAAQNLAAEGYTIDVPIMVWGWDPLATMLERQVDGYTWVPSAMQSDVGSAPGVSYYASANYDPTTPPPGSILVTTAFANGTNGQDAAAQYIETPATA